MPGPRNAGKAVDKPENSKATSKRMIHDLKPERVKLIAVMIFSVLSAVLSIFSPFVIKELTNSLVPGENFANWKVEGALITIGVDNSIIIDWRQFYILFGIIVALYVLSALCNFFSQYVAVGVSARYAQGMRQRVQRKLNTLPLSYYDRVPYGDTLSVATNDVDNISRNIQSIITQVFVSGTLFLGTVIAMFIVKWQLALVAIASLPITLTIVFFIAKYSGRQFVNYRNELGTLNGQIEEDYAGYTIIKLFNKQVDVENEFGKNNKVLAKSDYLSQFLSGFVFPTTIFINNLCFVAISVIAGQLNDIPSMVTFFIFLNMFSRPLQNLSQIFSTLQSVIASGERIYNLLDEKQSIPETKNAIDDEKDIKGDFEFRHVYFHYLPEKPLIEDFNLKVNAGDTIAIVGPTGAGKTTMVNLIMRFYELSNTMTKDDLIAQENYLMNKVSSITGKPITHANTPSFDDSLSIQENIELAKKNVMAYYDECVKGLDETKFNRKELEEKLPDYLNDGELLLDNVPTTDYTRSALRGSVGMVLQDTWLFKGTIKENLLYGDQNATDEEIIEACKEAHIYHYIQTLPGQLEFMLNEDGNNISQGQRQLITIARAIISKPKIMILDEATSSVDTRTELKIQDALDKIMKNRTSFVIAHRLSTIKNSKMIIVMKKGHIVETGNHKDLLAKNGFYAELYNAQFSGINPMAKKDGDVVDS
jgi:ATP-binding cassette, subfamily B, multidrug efflux pump